MKTGKSLERIVSEIEAHLIPMGLTVERRTRVFDDDGVQVAEFDLQVKGRVGSTDFHWLIECRDRPSNHSEPGSWIQQLAGRRQAYEFDKVTAVSTSGFSPGAVRDAELLNVELRTISPVDREAVSDWFRLETVSVFVLRSNVQDAKVFYTAEATEAAKRWVEANRSSCTFLDKCLYSQETGELHSILEAWQGFINQRPEFGLQFKENLDSQQINQTVNYVNPQSRFEFTTPHGKVAIRAIRFKVDLSIEQDAIPIEKFSEYREILGDRKIAQTVAIPFEFEGGKYECRFHNFGVSDETLVRFGPLKPGDESKDENAEGGD